MQDKLMICPDISNLSLPVQMEIKLKIIHTLFQQTVSLLVLPENKLGILNLCNCSHSSFENKLQVL